MFRNCQFAMVWLLSAVFAWESGAIDLLEKYPTKLVSGDTTPERAREWEFKAEDIYQLAQFKFVAGNDFTVEMDRSDVGIGHTTDGAVWALVIGREPGVLHRKEGTEKVAHVWLRFHPAELGELFPPETVLEGGDGDRLMEMGLIAGVKILSSWHAGPRATIPDRGILTVDMDTTEGVRRFYSVDTNAGSVQYIAAAEKRVVRRPPPITPELAESAFDQLWKAFDESYAMFVLRPEVDWDELREEFRQQAVESKSTYEFAAVCAEMLRPLRDLHVWLTLAGTEVPVFNRPRKANANTAAFPALLGSLQTAGRAIRWAVTPEKIGYVFIQGWSERDIPEQFDMALEQMRDTRGLIVDVRLNGGGSEPLAQEVAGRFLTHDFTYAFSRVRSGPAHEDLSEKRPRNVSPRGPWQYTRPVLLLIGERCMSSNESFIKMMTGSTNVTTMGDSTCGSSGNPRMVQLPLEVTVSVPRWIDYLPDGTPLDERGIQPHVRYEPKEGDFEGTRDGLLEAALEEMRKAPLPAEPIASSGWIPVEAMAPQSLRKRPETLPDYTSAVQEQSADRSRPRIVSVFPENDAEEVEPNTRIRIRFDRAMDPLALKLDWNAGGFLHCDFPEYDAETFEFTLPIRLAPGAFHEVALNNIFMGTHQIGVRPRDGFQGEDHRLGQFFAWHFRTGGAGFPNGTNRAKVVSIKPSSGEKVPLLSFVELQFDRPMLPASEAFPYLLKKPGIGPGMISSIGYGAGKRTFTIPLLLKPTGKTEFVIAGLRDNAGVVTEPVRLEYEDSSEDLAREGTAEDPALIDLLKRMKEKRSGISSISERVQTLSMHQEDGLFIRIRSTGAEFHWEEPNKYYGDVGGIMSTPEFRVGSDGTNWWWHYHSEKTNRLEMVPESEMRADVSICDPFGLTDRSPEETVEMLQLKYHGLHKRGEKEAHLVDRWEATRFSELSYASGRKMAWWIDAGTLLPMEIEVFGDGHVARSRFIYDGVKAALPEETFQPVIPGLTPQAAGPLEEGYTNRFVNVRDGSDGLMSVRWGKEGPKGSRSSGLN